MSLSIKNITKSYGTQRALDNVSVEIAEGQVVGLLGPNGAGKSTLMKVVTGYVQPDAGNVSVCGIDPTQEPTAVRRLLGYLPEHNPLYTEMYVREYLTMVVGMYAKEGERWQSHKAMAQRVETLVEMTGLGPEAHKKIGALSKGYRQRVGIAQALAGNPSVVILDEPTTGLDPNQIIEIRQLIRSLASERTVVLSTHIMQEVQAVCDHLVIIDHGHIQAQGSVEDVLSIGAGGQVVNVTFDADIDAEDLANTLHAQVRTTGSNSFTVSTSGTDDDLRILLFRYAVSHGAPLLHLSQGGSDIEDIFHRLTQQDAQATEQIG